MSKGDAKFQTSPPPLYLFRNQLRTKVVKDVLQVYCWVGLGWNKLFMQSLRLLSLPKSYIGCYYAVSPWLLFKRETILRILPLLVRKTVALQPDPVFKAAAGQALATPLPCSSAGKASAPLAAPPAAGGTCTSSRPIL